MFGFNGYAVCSTDSLVVPATVVNEEVVVSVGGHRCRWFTDGEIESAIGRSKVVMSVCTACDGGMFE